MSHVAFDGMLFYPCTTNDQFAHAADMCEKKHSKIFVLQSRSENLSFFGPRLRAGRMEPQKEYRRFENAGYQPSRWLRFLLSQCIPRLMG